MRSKSLFQSLALVLFLLAGSRGFAQESSPQPEYKLKAFFLYNFAVYTEWPSLPAESFEFCVLGKDPFGSWLDPIAQKSLQGKTIHIRRMSAGTELKGCHLLFIPATEKESFARLAPVITQQAILTITDARQIDEKWPIIMITLVPDENRFTFDINQSAAKIAGLTFSSKLLRLARNVK